MWRNKKEGNFYNPKIGLGTAVDCKWGEWNKWGSCTSLGMSYPPCYQARTRKKIQGARNGGQDCEHSRRMPRTKNEAGEAIQLYYCVRFVHDFFHVTFVQFNFLSCGVVS